MITCSKCNTSFPIEVQKISKDSTLSCISCGNPCIVKLLDLENHQLQAENDQNGFSSIDVTSGSQRMDGKEDSSNNFSIKKHIVITTLCLKILLIAFILGIINIQSIDSNFPILAKFYNMINIFPRKTVVISDIKILNNQQSFDVVMKITNLSDKSELVSDVVIVVYDIFHNPLSVFEKRPNLVVKPNSEFNLEFNIQGITDDAKYSSIFMNGKMQIESAGIRKLVVKK